MAVSHGRGDFKHDAVMCVFIDELGRIRETIKVDHLRDKQFEIDRGIFMPEANKEHPTDAFKAFVQKRQPACIVVGGFTVATHDRVFNRVRALVGELAEEKVNNQHRDDQGGSGWGAPQTDPAERERELAEATLPVIYVPDAAARLYQHSERAKKEFPAMPQNARYCVGLGRYVQSPIHEYCAMRADITAITVDDDSQKLVRRC
jgi:transcription elongation factor SPT6